MSYTFESPKNQIRKYLKNKYVPLYRWNEYKHELPIFAENLVLSYQQLGLHSFLLCLILKVRCLTEIDSFHFLLCYNIEFVKQTKIYIFSHCLLIKVLCFI